MTAARSITRDISYASAARSRGARTLIRVLENATGRLSLIRRADGYEADIARGRSFWQVMPERYGLRLEVTRGALADIPAQGPLVVIANHPFGILDGLMMGHLLDTVRGDFRILANAVFRKAPDLDRVLLPISFDPGPEAVAANLGTRARALGWLREGGAVGVFPGGTVSTAARPFGRPFDPGWRRFTARMIAKSGATVVPVFFEGQNSRLFQIASHMHYTLRLGLLIKEFRARVDAPVRIAIGAPIPPAALAHLHGDPGAMMAHLRAATYALSPGLPQGAPLGYEFEDHHRDR
ncbi:MAG: lysophospholipid acyltransferase family protein [Gemmobacter sp.]|jgi:putative hemolysin